MFIQIHSIDFPFLPPFPFSSTPLVYSTVLSSILMKFPHSLFCISFCTSEEPCDLCFLGLAYFT